MGRTHGVRSSTHVRETADKFFKTLVLKEIVSEVPMAEIARKYGL